eukprot:350783-Chlamydomonas_euryale.AAC.5
MKKVFNTQAVYHQLGPTFVSTLFANHPKRDEALNRSEAYNIDTWAFYHRCFSSLHRASCVSGGFLLASILFARTRSTLSRCPRRQGVRGRSFKLGRPAAGSAGQLAWTCQVAPASQLQLGSPFSCLPRGHDHARVSLLNVSGLPPDDMSTCGWYICAAASTAAAAARATAPPRAAALRSVPRATRRAAALTALVALAARRGGRPAGAATAAAACRGAALLAGRPSRVWARRRAEAVLPPQRRRAARPRRRPGHMQCRRASLCRQLPAAATASRRGAGALADARRPRQRVALRLRRQIGLSRGRRRRRRRRAGIGRCAAPGEEVGDAARQQQQQRVHVNKARALGAAHHARLAQPRQALPQRRRQRVGRRRVEEVGCGVGRHRRRQQRAHGRRPVGDRGAPRRREQHLEQVEQRREKVPHRRAPRHTRREADQTAERADLGVGAVPHRAREQAVQRWVRQRDGAPRRRAWTLPRACSAAALHVFQSCVLERVGALHAPHRPRRRRRHLA